MTPLHGGTGVTILPARGLVVGQGLGPVTSVLPGLPGDRVVSNGVNWVSGNGVARRVMEMFPLAHGSNSLSFVGFNSAGQTQSGISGFGTTSIITPGHLVINPITTTTLKIYDYAGYTNPVLMKPIWDFIWSFGPDTLDSGLYWAALANGDISALTAPTSTVGVYVDGPVTGTYIAYVHDGTTASIFDTGISTGGTVVHKFRFDMSDGINAVFYMDDAILHTFTSIPNVYLGYHYSAQENSGNVSVFIGKARLESI